MTLLQFLQSAAQALATVSPHPRLDAEVLVKHVCQVNGAELITRAGQALSREQIERLEALLEQRQQGVPVAYLTGRREFWSLGLQVSPVTLIPRPETEMLVERALHRIPQDVAWTIADLGTGCGAIAIALATERSRCRLIATDVSKTALTLAQHNARQHGILNIEFRQGNWLAPLSGEIVEVIVSNPPYVRAGDPHLKQGDVRFEPIEALVAGPDGLDAIRRIAFHARHHLKPDGWLLLEHSPEQRDALRRLLRQYGYGEISCYRDFAGLDRVSEARLVKK